MKIMDEIRFTKVLTKYSTEYNNQLFIFNLSQQMNMDKKDMLSFFQEFRLHVGDDVHEKVNIIENIFANLSRGRNILDLAVIREKTIINNITVYRPMIQFYKS